MSRSAQHADLEFLDHQRWNVTKLEFSKEVLKCLYSAFIVSERLLVISGPGKINLIHKCREPFRSSVELAAVDRFTNTDFGALCLCQSSRAGNGLKYVM